MKQKKFVDWYELPEGYRNTLVKKSEMFEIFRHDGAWSINPKTSGYEQTAIAIIRRRGTLYSDSIMPRFKKLMEQGFRVAVFLVGMKVVDIVIYEPV